jgi:hypothetical protein
MRKAVGANNVLLGMHISAWTPDGDVLNGEPVSVVNSAARSHELFYRHLGLDADAANPTGQTYDFLVADPSDRDANYYAIVRQDGGAHWWDPSETPDPQKNSFKRFRTWLSYWSEHTGKRWVLWQIPCGNAASPDNDAKGYKDNRAEYFFSPRADDAGVSSATHRQGFAEAGVMALLFGRGAGGQTTYPDDPWTDGKPFISTYAGAYLTNKPPNLPALPVQ